MQNEAVPASVEQIEVSAPPQKPVITQLLPWLVAMAFFMESLDTTILNTAVPIIAHAMGVPALSVKSVLASYTLSLAVFIPISGWMADRYGTRLIFTCAIAIFTFASFLAGLSHDIHLLTACRILQGIGGAMMVPVGRLTLVKTYSKSDLVRILSFVTIFGWAGPVLGPVLGGAIVAHFEWSVIFFVNIPIGIVGLILVRRYLPDYREEVREPLDFLGFILFGVGIALMSHVLEVFGDHIMDHQTVIALFALSVALLIAYAIHSLRVPSPLLKVKLLRIRTFKVSVIGSFVTRLGVGGVPFLLPLLYQLALGYSPMTSGLLILPQAVSGILAKLALPFLLDKLGFRNMLIINTVSLAVLLALFATVGPGTPIWVIVMQAAAYGACSSLQYTTMNTMAYADVDDHSKGGAGSISSTSQELSISFGIASAGLITAMFIPSSGASNELISIGLHSAFLVLGAMTLVSTLVFSQLKANDGEAVSHHHQVR